MSGDTSEVPPPRAHVRLGRIVEPAAVPAVPMDAIRDLHVVTDQDDAPRAEIHGEVERLESRISAPPDFIAAEEKAIDTNPAAHAHDAGELLRDRLVRRDPQPRETRNPARSPPPCSVAGIEGVGGRCEPPALIDCQNSEPPSPLSLVSSEPFPFGGSGRPGSDEDGDVGAPVGEPRRAACFAALASADLRAVSALRAAA